MEYSDFKHNNHDDLARLMGNIQRNLSAERSIEHQKFLLQSAVLYQTLMHKGEIGYAKSTNLLEIAQVFSLVGLREKMVSFVCDVCQETLKKPKLDSHKARCHQAIFSCIDCYKTFSGTEYKSHTSCITEVQKYHKKPSKLESFLKPQGQPLLKSLSMDDVKKQENEEDQKNLVSENTMQAKECKDGREILLKALKKKSLGYQKICKKFDKKGKDFSKLLSNATFLLENDTIIIQL